MASRSDMQAESLGGHTVEFGRVPYDDVLESQRFRDFLPTKNGVEVFDLVGSDGGTRETGARQSSIV